jgi:hypothetical protein
MEYWACSLENMGITRSALLVTEAASSMQIHVTGRGGYKNSRFDWALLEYGHKVVRLDSGS